MGVILLTKGLPQVPDFEDQCDLRRGQRSGKAEGKWWVSFFLTEGLPQELEDQIGPLTLWRLASGAWFWGPGWPLERPEVRQNRVKLGVILQSEGPPQEPDLKDQGNLRRGQRPGKAKTEWWVSFSSRRAYLRSWIILLTEGLPPELNHSPDWGLTSGAESFSWLRAYLWSLILRTRVTSGEARGQAKQ